jgi:phage antirepressor YoqD-like protein
MLRSSQFAEILLKKLYDEREKSAVLEQLAVELAPKALYCDMILQCRDAVPVSLIAKDYGMSATAFNRLLHQLGIQYRTGGTWLLYQKYSGWGYTQTRTYRVDEKISAIHTCWTQKGRLFLYGTPLSASSFPAITRKKRRSASKPGRRTPPPYNGRQIPKRRE